MTSPSGDLPRLYVDASLEEGASVEASTAQSHYLLHVLRRAAGGSVALFNGRDGEWAATIVARGKRDVAFAVETLRRAQSAAPSLTLIFAPLKSTRQDLVVEKATELGVSALMPILTRRTNTSRVNLERMTSIAVEAAEQCERLCVPKVFEPQRLDALMAVWSAGQVRERVFFLDENAARDGSARPVNLAFRDAPEASAAILVGPEGGFDPAEQAMLRALPFVTPMTLGPRILRAETAAIAALACWQAARGDWTI